MSGDTIFREYRISDAERSDRSAGDLLRHRHKERDLAGMIERSGARRSGNSGAALAPAASPLSSGLTCRPA